MRQCLDKTVASKDLRLETVRGFCFGGKDDHVTMFILHLPLAVFSFQKCFVSIKGDFWSDNDQNTVCLFTLRFKAASHW